ncbi:MAG: iron donor protein CyaY [Pseudomonadota bacterium]
MTDQAYPQLADTLFQQLETRLEAADLDYELAPGGILEIEFEDGSKIVINRQPPLQEVWVASKSGGFHYRHVEGAWRDTRAGDELFTALSEMATRQAGRAVDLTREGA